MFKPLTILHLRPGDFKITNFYGTGAVNLFNNIRPIPFRKEFAYKEPETRLIQQNFFTNVKFTFQNSFVVPPLNIVLEKSGTLISLTSPLI